MNDSDTLLTFFKAMADKTRLKIVGFLAQQPYSVEQLAAQLELSPSTVSHHLTKLAEAGLVSAAAEGYYSVYRLNVDQIEAMARTLLSSETLPAIAPTPNPDAFAQKVLHDYLLPDGRLKTVPSQRKKLEAVLHHLLQDFEVGRKYSEKEVNEIIARYHEDTAGLRRDLIDFKLLTRTAGGREYWRTE